MITDEQKEKIKKLARMHRFIKKKNQYIEGTLDLRVLEKFDDDFDKQKYLDIKRYTEEWYGQ